MTQTQVLVASAATQQEIQESQGKHQDGTKPIAYEKPAYQPK